MPIRLPKGEGFDGFRTIELDEQGRLREKGAPVMPAYLPEVLARLLTVPSRVTDIFVFVHGWQHDRMTATAMARRFFSAVWTIWHQQPMRYRGLSGFLPFFVSVQWPSRSVPMRHGYRRIRDRAHEMTTRGHAAHVLAALLGYLDSHRRRPSSSATLRTAGGSYLHCIGHSFGCRVLGEAMIRAASPGPDPTLAWPWRVDFPFSVDSFLGFQMAAPPDIFAGRFRLLAEGRAPVVGPIVLTFSARDRALSLWHRLPEGSPGLGAIGAVGAPAIRLHQLGEEYRVEEFSKVTNVDAGWLYRGRGWSLQGGHCDIWYAESVHLLLSLTDLSR